MSTRYNPRQLTDAQHERLDLIADKHPDAKVVGWWLDGPIIQRGDRRVALVRHYMRPKGRLVKMARERQQ